MASQIFLVATISGRAAAWVQKLFAAWEAATLDGSNEVNPDLDTFCEGLRDHRKELPILYYCEWIDRWLFARDASDATWVIGHRFEACCISPERAASLGARPNQHQEHVWLSARLREASIAWKPLVRNAVILVVREVFAGSVTDAEVRTAADIVPQWLSPK